MDIVTLEAINIFRAVQSTKLDADKSIKLDIEEFRNGRKSFPCDIGSNLRFYNMVTPWFTAW